MEKVDISCCSIRYLNMIISRICLLKIIFYCRAKIILFYIRGIKKSFRFDKIDLCTRNLKYNWFNIILSIMIILNIFRINIIPPLIINNFFLGTLKIRKKDIKKDKNNLFAPSCQTADSPIFVWTPINSDKKNYIKFMYFKMYNWFVILSKYNSYLPHMINLHFKNKNDNIHKSVALKR